jgi:hypothetical protein
MIKAVIRGLEESSGRKFDSWVKTAKSSGLRGHKALTDWLKQEHGLRHQQALFVAWGVTDPGRVTAYEDPDKLMRELYSGRKAHLRPVFEALRQAALKLPGVDEVACKTYASYRNRAQFAIAAPRTQKFLDLELAMPPGTKATKRLEPFSGSNEKFTHRIRLAKAKEVDKEVLKALQLASEHIGGK